MISIAVSLGFLLFAIIYFSGVVKHEDENKYRNILFIVADDLGIFFEFNREAYMMIRYIKDINKVGLTLVMEKVKL